MRKFLGAILLVLILAAACGPGPMPAPPPATGAPSTRLSSPPTITAPTGTLAPARVVDDPQFYAAALSSANRNDLALLDRPTRYALNLSFNSNDLTLSGSEAVRYTNRQATTLNEIYFRLFANHPESGGKIVVKNLTIDGASVSPLLETQNTALRVPLPKLLAPNATVSAQLEFIVTIPRDSKGHYADFTSTDGVTTLPSIYPLIPAYDAQGWHTELPPSYGDLVYAEASFYAVTVTVPSAISVIASGVATGKKENSDGTTTWSYVGAPMRDFDINFGEQLQKSSAQVGETDVNSFYAATDAENGKNALQFAVDALKIFSTRFGAYPYREFNVIETPTTAGGIEYPGVASIARGLYRNERQRDFFEFAIAHEVSHQWWYALVGNDQVNLPWVDESLAQYSTLVYYEDLRGVSAGQNILKNQFQAQYNRAKDAGKDKAVNLPVSAYNEADYSAIVYQKGPLFYDAIHKKMGDATFFKFLQSYFQKYRYKIATGDDILTTAQATCGCNLRDEYQQWILNPR